MNIRKIIVQLRSERERIDRAIATLEALNSLSHTATRKSRTPKVQGKATKRRKLTAAGRKRISDAMKKRWAERRKAS